MYKGRSTESGESVADPVWRGPPSLAPPPRRHRKTSPADRDNRSIGRDDCPSAPCTTQSAANPHESQRLLTVIFSQELSLHAFALWTIQWRWLVFDSSPFFPSVRFSTCHA